MSDAGNLKDFYWNKLKTLKSDHPKYLYVSCQGWDRLDDLMLRFDGCWVCAHVGYHGWKWTPGYWLLRWHLNRVASER